MTEEVEQVLDMIILADEHDVVVEVLHNFLINLQNGNSISESKRSALEDWDC